MKILDLVFLSAGAAALASAHPMGNFSVSHYARFDIRPGAVDLTYVLDLAEIPTFELTQAWNIDATNRTAIRSRASDQRGEWLSGLLITADGHPIRPRFRGASAQVTDGAGGMLVLRVTVSAVLPVHASSIRYEDKNYAGRAGWKEIVVVPHGTTLIATSAGTHDRSGALQSYPVDAISAPPQDTSASFRWSEPLQAAKAVPAAPQPPAADLPVAAPRFSEQQQQKAMGTVVRGDFLSRMLGGREITTGMVLIGLCVAFGLGAAHALSPGHGKTIVAAYLVGSRGTMKHALFLGGMVTFTHTISVFALGLGMLLFQRYVVPEKVIPALGVLSGLSIVAIGSMLLYQRAKRLAAHSHEHAHAHSHAHDHHHHHEHDHHHSHDHHHHHDHDHHHEHHHDHHHHGHSHVPEGKITLGSLIALGASGGLVPCPSALVLLLSAIALGRTGLGLLLLLAFSTGLALVLMGIGAMVLYAKSLLPQRAALSAPLFRYVPVLSAGVVTVLGLVMTGVSAGWIRPVLGG
jgi:ABC-type nickel/cobalt efflux system permease component RcnA